MGRFFDYDFVSGGYEVSCTTVKELIEKERKRLIETIKNNPEWWNSKDRSNWVRKQYGETLTEKDGRIDHFGRPVKHRCDVCGKEFEFEEKFIEIETPDDYFQACRDHFRVFGKE